MRCSNFGVKRQPQGEMGFWDERHRTHALSTAPAACSSLPKACSPWRAAGERFRSSRGQPRQSQSPALCAVATIGFQKRALCVGQKKTGETAATELARLKSMQLGSAQTLTRFYRPSGDIDDDLQGLSQRRLQLDCLKQSSLSESEWGLRMDFSTAVRAKPRGTARPCSHSCSVRFETFRLPNDVPIQLINENMAQALSQLQQLRREMRVLFTSQNTLLTPPQYPAGVRRIPTFRVRQDCRQHGRLLPR